MFECYRGGKKVSTITSGEIVDKSAALWADHFTGSSGDIPDGKLFNVEVNSG